MNKKLLLNIAAAALVGIPSICQAEMMCKTECCPPVRCCQPSCCRLNTGFTISALGGANWVHNRVHLGHIKYKTGYLVGGSVGFLTQMGFGLDAEVIYRRNSLKRFHFNDDSFDINGHLRKWTYMANAKYYFCPTCNLTPYVGGGIGYANQKLHINNLNNLSINSNQHRKGFAWQALAGVTWSFWECSSLDLNYHYLQLKSSIHDNSFIAGLTFSF